MSVNALFAQLIAVFLTVAALVQSGIIISGMGYIAFPLLQWLASLLGITPSHSRTPQILFDRIFAQLFTSFRARLRGCDRASRTTQLSLQLALAGSVTVLGIAVELVSILAVTGVALTKYHVAGVAMDVTGAYHASVATAVLLTLVCMTYGNQKIQQATASARGRRTAW